MLLLAGAGRACSQKEQAATVMDPFTDIERVELLLRINFSRVCLVCSRSHHLRLLERVEFVVHLTVVILLFVLEN